MSSSITGVSFASVASRLAVAGAAVWFPVGMTIAAEEGARQPAVEEIVVTAQRREERISEVPISVHAVTGDQLARAAITDTRMLESISPSVSFQGGFNAAATSLSIRGVSSNSQEGGIQPSTALVVDNVPVARQNEFVFDFADIERVEVLNGPQGTLFGKNATAGVVNVVTNRPIEAFEGSADVTATNDSEYAMHAVLNTPVSPGIAARFNGFYRDQAPLVTNLGGRDAFGAHVYGFGGKVGFELSSEANLVIGAGYSKLRSSYTSNMVIVPITGPLGELQTQVRGIPAGRGVDVINQNGLPYDFMTNRNVGAELDWELSDTLSLFSVTGYRTSDEHGGTDVDSTPVGLAEGQGFTPNPLGYPLQWVNVKDGHIKDDLKYGSQEFRLEYHSGPVKAIGGVFAQRLRERRTSRLPLIFAASYLGLPGPGDTRYFSDASSRARLEDDSAAVFGDITYEVTPTVSVFSGLRYSYESLDVDYHRDNFFNPVEGFLDPVTLANTAPPAATTDFQADRSDTNLSGRAGIQWRPSDDRNFYLSYNRGYKGAAANISNDSSGVDALLEPETADSVELGAKQRFFDGRLALDVAIYHQAIDNIQQTSVAPNQLFTKFINAGELRSDGIEINVVATPALGLQLSLGGAYTDARYHGGRYPCNPTELANASPKCDASGIKSLTDEQSIGTPKVKITSAIDYEYDLPGPLTLTSRAAYNWQSSIQYQLGDDPLTREPDRGIANLSGGVRSDDGRFNATLFVNNVTDKFYYNYVNHADFFIGRSFGSVGRDYRRYGGLRMTYAF